MIDFFSFFDVILLLKLSNKYYDDRILFYEVGLFLLNNVVSFCYLRMLFCLMRP